MSISPRSGTRRFQRLICLKYNSMFPPTAQHSLLFFVNEWPNWGETEIHTALRNIPQKQTQSSYCRYIKGKCMFARIWLEWIHWDRDLIMYGFHHFVKFLLHSSTKLGLEVTQFNYSVD